MQYGSRTALAAVAGLALAFALLASALAFNLSMLPYVMWFKIAMPATFFGACLLGTRTGARGLPTVPSAAARR